MINIQDEGVVCTMETTGKGIIAKRVKAIMFTVLLCTAVLSSVLMFTAGTSDVKAQSQITGTVNAGVTALRVRTSTDTSSTANVITKVDGGQKFDILDTIKVSSNYSWYKVGFTYGGKYTIGYVSSDYVTIDTENNDGSDYDDSGDFEAYLSSQNFPESYKESLRQLHKKYPKWVFIADHTGKDWNTVVANENVIGRSLIYSSAKSSWKSTDPKAYNWEKDEWYSFDSGGWVQASDELVRYALDPRNFIDEDYIFMFETLSYNKNIHTEAGVSNVISNSFMASSNHDLSFNGKSYTYASGLVQAGTQSGVSPFHLATRIIQEQGNDGKGNSISGNVSGYNGYYNYYNQGAYKTSANSAVVNGLRFASISDSTTLRPWNTRMKSIVGGAVYLGRNYINRGQDTLYYEKFDLKTPYTHQYMTNILAPRSESQTASKAYSQNAKNSTSIVFKIPVYNNMPSKACALPTGDGNPNNTLKSLSVDGQTLTPTFSMFTTSYDLIVENNITSINVSAAASSSSATISGTGVHNLDVGRNTVNVNVVSQSGKTMTYTINVVRKEAASDDGSNGGNKPDDSKPDNSKPGDNTGGNDQGGTTDKPGFTTDYVLNNTEKTVSGVGVGSNAVDVLNAVKCYGGATARIIDRNGNENNGTVGTGSCLVICNSAGQEIQRYTFIIYGDMNGDGKIDIYDLIKMRQHLLGIKSLDGVYVKAADTNRKNDGINIYDLIYLRRHLLGISYISQ